MTAITQPNEGGTGTALCPDGVRRPFTMRNGTAIVELRGKIIGGKVTVVDGVPTFRPAARHHGAHRMWYPDPTGTAPDGVDPAAPKAPIDPFSKRDVSDEPRGQPDNAGEWTSGSGGGGKSPEQKTPLHQPIPLIAPHLSRPVVNPSGRGGRKENLTATTFDTLPPKFQHKILAQVKRESPNQLTPEKMDANLEDVFNHAADDATAQAGAHWYNDAHADGEALSKSANVSLPAAVGMIAAMSPQTDWDSNIAMANFVGKKLSEDKPVNLPDEEVAYRQRQSQASKGDAHNVRIPNGKRLSEMTPGEAAWAMYAMASTEKLTNGLKTLKGKPKKVQLSMGAQNVSKAIRIYRGEEPGEILSGHKVRSFFNNIMDPTDSEGRHDVTVDTHAVSAAAGTRITASGRTIKKMFDASANTAANVKGAYALFADAYRRLAARHGLTPNQAQAIVWTHWQTVKGVHEGYREQHPEIPDDVPAKTEKVKAKERETKERAKRLASGNSPVAKSVWVVD